MHGRRIIELGWLFLYPGCCFYLSDFTSGCGCGLVGISFMLRGSLKIGFIFIVVLNQWLSPNIGAIVTLTDLPEVIETLTRGNCTVSSFFVSSSQLVLLIKPPTSQSQRVYHQMMSCGQSTLLGPLHEPTVLPINWTMDTPTEAVAPYDVVLLTDCVFSVTLVPHLLRQIRNLSGPKTIIYCCHEIRDEVRLLSIFHFTDTNLCAHRKQMHFSLKNLKKSPQ